MASKNQPPRRISMAYILGFSDKPFKDVKPPPPPKPPAPKKPNALVQIMTTPGAAFEYIASDGRKGALTGRSKTRLTAANLARVPIETTPVKPTSAPKVATNKVASNKVAPKKVPSKKAASIPAVDGFIGMADFADMLQVVDSGPDGGDANSSGWTKEQDEELMRRKNEGETWAVITEAMGKDKFELSNRFKEIKPSDWQAPQTKAKAGGGNKGGHKEHGKNKGKHNQDKKEEPNQGVGDTTWGGGGIGEGFGGDTAAADWQKNDATSGDAANGAVAATDWQKNDVSGEAGGNDTSGFNTGKDAATTSNGNAADQWGAANTTDNNNGAAQEATAWGQDAQAGTQNDQAWDTVGASKTQETPAWDTNNNDAVNTTGDTGNGFGGGWDAPAAGSKKSSSKKASNAGDNAWAGAGDAWNAASAGSKKASSKKASIIGGDNAWAGAGDTWNAAPADSKKASSKKASNAGGGDNAWPAAGDAGAWNAAPAAASKKTSSKKASNAGEAAWPAAGGWNNNNNNPTPCSVKPASHHDSKHKHASKPEPSSPLKPSSIIPMVDLKPDETFTHDELKLVARLMKQDFDNTWYRLMCRFQDKTGRRVHPHVFEKKVTGRVVSRDPFRNV